MKFKYKKIFNKKNYFLIFILILITIIFITFNSYGDYMPISTLIPSKYSINTNKKYYFSKWEKSIYLPNLVSEKKSYFYIINTLYLQEFELNNENYIFNIDIQSAPEYNVGFKQNVSETIPILKNSKYKIMGDNNLVFDNYIDYNNNTISSKNVNKYYYENDKAHFLQVSHFVGIFLKYNELSFGIITNYCPYNSADPKTYYGIDLSNSIIGDVSISYLSDFSNPVDMFDENDYKNQKNSSIDNIGNIKNLVLQAKSKFLNNMSDSYKSTYEKDSGVDLGGYFTRNDLSNFWNYPMFHAGVILAPTNSNYASSDSTKYNNYESDDGDAVSSSIIGPDLNPSLCNLNVKKSFNYYDNMNGQDPNALCNNSKISYKWSCSDKNKNNEDNILISNNYNPNDWFVNTINTYMYIRYMYQSIIDSKGNNTFDPVLYSNSSKSIRLSDLMIIITKYVDQSLIIQPFVNNLVIDKTISPDYAKLLEQTNQIFLSIPSLMTRVIPGANEYAFVSKFFKWYLWAFVKSLQILSPISIPDDLVKHAKDSGESLFFSTKINYLSNTLDIIFNKLLKIDPNNDITLSNFKPWKSPLRIVNYKIALLDWSANGTWDSSITSNFTWGQTTSNGKTYLNFKNSKLNISLQVEY